jgi:hypothetical protein
MASYNDQQCLHNFNHNCLILEYLYSQFETYQATFNFQPDTAKGASA